MPWVAHGKSMLISGFQSCTAGTAAGSRTWRQLSTQRQFAPCPPAVMAEITRRSKLSTSMPNLDMIEAHGGTNTVSLQNGKHC